MTSVPAVTVGSELGQATVTRLCIEVAYASVFFLFIVSFIVYIWNSCPTGTQPEASPDCNVDQLYRMTDRRSRSSYISSVQYSHLYAS